jgi:epoxyqueuosine reductase
MEKLNQKAIDCPECIAFGCVLLPPASLPHSLRLDEWLKKNFNANMDWMSRTAETRKQPANFNEKSYNAAWIGLWKYPRSIQKKQEPIAAYAHGIDYHITIGNILNEWAMEIDGLPFVDSLPIAERELAVMAGLGFIGKNTMLINPKYGSGFFIGGILMRSEEALHTKPMQSQNNCAHCRKCIDACPNNALSEDGFLDSRRCASYLTIEHRGEFNEKQKEWAKHSIFGCDICQRACPYNASHLAETEPYFSQNENEWKKKTIKGSPLWRAGTKNLKRNTENYIAARQAAVCLPPAFCNTFATSGNVEPGPIASAQSIGV